MYTNYFGLSALPFENSPDPGFFFDHGRHAEVLDLMQDFVTTSRGLLVVAGPIGTGKTTLSQMLVRELPEHIKLIWLVEPPATAKDFVMFVAQELGVAYTYETRLFIIRDLVKRLVELHASGKRTLIIVDEAHLMSAEVLEGVRIMNNFEKGADKLVHVVLIGQEELLATLEDPAMRPLRQRISTTINLGRMSPPMVRAYIEHRLALAQAPQDLMSPLAIDTIAHVSGGAPRLVNTLCNIAFRNAYVKKTKVVDYEEAFRAAEELGLGKAALHHLINLSSDAQLETLKAVDLEAWASRIREEVAREKAAARESGGAVVSAAGEAGASSSATAPGKLRDARRHGAGMAQAGQSGQSGQSGRTTRPWLMPLLLLGLSLATLAASVYYYGPRLGLDVTQHLMEFKRLVSLLHP
ncbi:ExeA family protein [Megalodesulfovibrio gigas]|uniref:Putative type II secretion system protein E n=1 Tax=Megalodesulfovibrio gigas (strain ATCC 19364 / DSM 1382 / NCIMB 9332 / VKM B-1759) TaxID=1121448 RepID=T2GBQ9_MEGG1|nr:ATPase, T2SS/T4P/T4SS family [Megalodesulfovibrio gigas]AGW13733.1 putative type II secretion system protein E [Megalodesulfovibrio gigas DSM 1382 = ATCC 19364]